jgi:hypothetical protein
VRIILCHLSTLFRSTAFENLSYAVSMLSDYVAMSRNEARIVLNLSLRVGMLTQGSLCCVLVGECILRPSYSIRGVGWVMKVTYVRVSAQGRSELKILPGKLCLYPHHGMTAVRSSDISFAMQKMWKPLYISFIETYTFIELLSLHTDRVDGSCMSACRSESS